MIIDLVDSIEYTTTAATGFISQLYEAMQRHDNVKTVALADVKKHDRPDLIVSRLKQRTLWRVAAHLASWAGDVPVVVYDQDPWESFRDDSKFKGTYDIVRQCLNVKEFVVTSLWWQQWLTEKGYPSRFVKMWLAPELCTSEPTLVNRNIELGFVGQLHPYRKELFDSLGSAGHRINVTGGMSHPSYLQHLSQIKTFIYRDEMPFTVDRVPHDLKHGLWGKAIEAAGRGCFVVRNHGDDWASYLTDIPSVMLYRDIKEAIALIDRIKNMDLIEAQDIVERSVATIRARDEWAVTAASLLYSCAPP